MMKLLGRILGGGEVIKEGFNLIDELHTSKEEEIKAHNDAKVRLLESYAPFKIAQRVLAIMFTVTFLSCFALVLGMTMAGQVNDLQDVRDVISEFWIGEIMLTIVAFYFGGGTLESFFRGRKDGK